MELQDLDIQLELKGFKKHPKFENFIKGLMDDLYMECPSDSCMKASFVKEGPMIIGSIQVNSIEGVFSARAEGNIPRDVIESVIDEMHRELKIWRKARNQIKKDGEYERTDFQELAARDSR